MAHHSIFDIPTISETLFNSSISDGFNHSSTLIEVTVVSNPELVHSSGVSEVTISDHFLVYLLLNLRPPKPMNSESP